MKKVIFRQSIIAALCIIGATQLKAQSNDERYTPFNSNSPYDKVESNDLTRDSGGLPGGPGTPIEDGYLAMLLLAIPYTIYLHRKRVRSVKA